MFSTMHVISGFAFDPHNTHTLTSPCSVLSTLSPSFPSFCLFLLSLSFWFCQGFTLVFLRLFRALFYLVGWRGSGLWEQVTAGKVSVCERFSLWAAYECFGWVSTWFGGARCVVTAHFRCGSVCLNSRRRSSWRFLGVHSNLWLQFRHAPFPVNVLKLLHLHTM